ncbi:hypothetical protein L3081_25375 [Colwellia sp. MSW7]|uniref:Uncharacterized protein n=1 Tax=Colwellia maritima TaxID=2912588 RepID=A0ABS9X7F9_9GAMM|nr:hypothetical protein [Colwellia maritima]MCI2286149.1 hypothetical protein [Colwellia maritima]
MASVPGQEQLTWTVDLPAGRHVNVSFVKRLSGIRTGIDQLHFDWRIAR